MAKMIWMDIPVGNMDRAITFYSNVLTLSVKIDDTHGKTVGVFGEKVDEPMGCLFESHEPIRNENGPLLYFNVEGRLDEAVGLVERLGGKIQRSRHSIDPFGYRALVIDSEGNRIALHSNH